MLEGRTGDRGADRRIGQRIDRGIGIARLAPRVSSARTSSGKVAASAVDADRRLARGPRRGCCRPRSSTADLADAAWRRPSVPPCTRRRNRAGRPARAAPASRRCATTSKVAVETTSVAVVLAGAAHVGDRRDDVDRRASVLSGGIEQGDVAGSGGDRRPRAGAADGVDAVSSSMISPALRAAGRAGRAGRCERSRSFTWVASFGWRRRRAARRPHRKRLLTLQAMRLHRRHDLNRPARPPPRSTS